jgi:hypothetical protein
MKDVPNISGATTAIRKKFILNRQHDGLDKGGHFNVRKFT